jgi:glycerate 2-kinase
MHLIKNYRQLTDNGDSLPERRARDMALDLIEQGIRAVMPEYLMAGHITCDGTKFGLWGEDLDFHDYDHVWVLGLGKASVKMARYLEKMIGSRITGGCVVADYPGSLQRIEVIVGGHPVPTDKSLEAGERLLTLSRLVSDRDLVLFLISGGGSALAEALIDGVTLDDLQAINRRMLELGLDVYDFNTVRQSLSRIKAGKLLGAVGHAKVVSLLLSDVTGYDLAFVASGPTIEQTVNWDKALTILRQIGTPSHLCDTVTLAQNEASRQSRREPEDHRPASTRNILIGSSHAALRAMEAHARSSGYAVAVLPQCQHEQARIAAIAMVDRMHNSIQHKPLVILQGGETTVQKKGKGHGGRNQEFVLSAMTAFRSLPTGCAVAAAGSDGIDFTSVAGAIATPESLLRTHRQRIDLRQALHDNDSFPVFAKLSDHIITGHTGTNVADLMVGVIAK